MEENDEAFEAMFKELQKTGDPYDYPNATWSVVESCKQLVQSRLESMEKDAARLDWLEESDEGHGFCHTEFGQYRHYAYKGAVRQAIDTAMKG